MKNALTLAELTGALSGTLVSENDPPDIAAAKRVQNALGLEVAIPNPCSVPTLLVKLAANKVHRFSADTWEEVAGKAIAELRLLAAARRKPTQAPQKQLQPNRRMRRAQAAFARKKR